MSKATIHYIGGIEDEKKGSNLTGSQTIFGLDIGKTRNPKIVIDAGAVQGVKKAEELNRQVKRDVLDADFLVITHAHADHAGMVPYLYKKGYSGRIIMTELTKLQCKAMWEDYVRLKQNEIEEVQELNAKMASKLKNAFIIKELYEKVIQPDTYLVKIKEEITQITHKNNAIKKFYTKHLIVKTAYEKIEELKKVNIKRLSKEEKIKINEDIERNTKRLLKNVKNQDPEIAYSESLKILAEQDIQNEKDISKLLKEVPKIEENQSNKSEAIAKIFDITESSNYETEYAIASARLKEFGIEYEKDISAVLREIPVLLFNNDDIERVYEKIEVLNLGEELELQNYHPVSVGDDKSVLKLVESVQAGNSKPIPVASYLKGTVTAKLKSLIKKTAKEIKENTKKEEANIQLKKDLKLAFEYARWYEEQTGDLEDFQKRYGKYLEINTDDIGNEIDRLGVIRLSTREYKTQELLQRFLSLGIQIPTLEEYMKLSGEFDEELGIKSLDDINKHLPELSENAYNSIDIRGVLKSAIFSSNTRPSEHIQFSSDIFDVYKIIDAYKNGKKVFFPQKNKAQLISTLETLIAENQSNIEKNNNLSREVSEAFDIVEMYEGNIQLYKQSKQKEYQKAKKFLKNHKIVKPIVPLYSEEDIDYILDIDYNSIQKTKKIIRIQKLSDYGLYDILIKKDSNTVYYFDPNIRERAKEKLKERIKQMHLDNLLIQDTNKLYQEYLEFVRRYETSDEHDISVESYHQAKSLLKKHNISQRQEINGLKFYETNLYFSKKDGEELIENITFLPNGGTIDDINTIVITDIDDERIFDLPSLYQDKTKVIIIQEELKAQIKEKLTKGIADFYKTYQIRRNKRKELTQNFQRYQMMRENSDILFNIEGFSSGQELYDFLLAQNAKIRELRELLGKHAHAKKLLEKISSGGEAKEEEYKNAISLLNKYHITNLDQITDVGEKLSEIKYSISAIERTISLLKSIHIDKNAEILESLKLNFFDAGHIEGSVQAVLTAVVSEVDNILSTGNKNPSHYGQKRRHKHINYGFSGDEGRIKDPNLAGTPDIIPFKLDYYQMEATYADRIHLDKQECINNFFNAIDTAQGKIIVPAFSMQRTQELLMITLQKMLASQPFKQEVGELKKQREIYLSEYKKISPKATDRDILDRKDFLDEEIHTLTLRIERYESLIFDIDIILDSPLSEKITDIYIDKCGEKYNLLDPKVQRELFGREVITYVKKTLPGEVTDPNKKTITLEELYSPERRDKKEIIFSASGMGDGGAIIPHLKENLPNPLSKIIKVGYAPLSTRLGKINAGDEFISIHGEPIELKCEVDDIPGFSGHIDEEEIIMMLTQMEFKKGAIIALTHGDEKRYLLAQKVQSAMEAVGKKVKVIVPKLADTTTIKL